MLYTPGLSENRGGTSIFYDFDRIGNLWTLDGTTKNQLGYIDFSGFGTTFAAAGTTSPFSFGGANGCQMDPDASLVLMGHRYYDPRTGRFISQDPAHDGGNWYAYVGNNPTNRSDPLGLYWAGGTLPGDYTPAEVEATAEAHDADPGQTFNVTTGDGHKYSFTVPGGGGQSLTGIGGMGWSLGIGIGNEFTHGTNNHNRNYGPSSTQARNMRNSQGYQQILLQIINGQTSGGVSSALAAYLTATDLGNGTQAQLGAFAWAFTDPSNSNMGIDITNDITVNSLFYHVPSTLNNLGVPNPTGIFNGGLNYATQWQSGAYGTIHQKIHLNFP